jgi:hypothetical protein
LRYRFCNISNWFTTNCRLHSQAFGFYRTMGKLRCHKPNRIIDLINSWLDLNRSGTFLLLKATVLYVLPDLGKRTNSQHHNISPGTFTFFSVTYIVFILQSRLAVGIHSGVYG